MKEGRREGSPGWAVGNRKSRMVHGRREEGGESEESKEDGRILCLALHNCIATCGRRIVCHIGLHILCFRFC